MFVGVFGFNLLIVDDFKLMVDKFVVFVCLNLDFEIVLEVVYSVCNDLIMVMGCLDFFN